MVNAGLVIFAKGVDGNVNSWIPRQKPSGIGRGAFHIIAIAGGVYGLAETEIFAPLGLGKTGFTRTRFDFFRAAVHRNANFRSAL